MTEFSREAMRPTEPDPEWVTAISTQCGVEPGAVRTVLITQELISRGMPIDTIQRDPVSGDVAVRVARDGVPGWWVINKSDGSAIFDRNPDKEWPAIYVPENS